MCCGLFSLLGALFLSILGVLLTYQYEYVHIESPHENHKVASENAYWGAIVYGVIMCICIFFYFKHSNNELRARRVSQHGVELEDISMPLMENNNHATSGHGEIYQRTTSRIVGT